MVPTSDHLTPEELASIAHAGHNEVIELARKELQALFNEAPGFAYECEDSDPAVCPIGKLVALIAQAPSTGLRMHLLQVYLMRQELAQITGRSFS